MQKEKERLSVALCRNYLKLRWRSKMPKWIKNEDRHLMDRSRTISSVVPFKVLCEIEMYSFEWKTNNSQTIRFLIEKGLEWYGGKLQGEPKRKRRVYRSIIDPSVRPLIVYRNR